MRKLVLLLTILLLPSVSTALNIINGEVLLSNCSEFIKGVDNPSDTNIDRERAYRCGSYLSGYIAASILYQDLLGDKGLICFPDQRMPVAHFGRVIVKYLKDRPNSLHVDKDTLTAAAAMEAFPCE